MGFEEIREALRRLIADLPDAEAGDRAKRAGDEFAAYQELVGELSRIRREAVEELQAQGLTHQQIADRIGTSRPRVGQVLSNSPKPARALLGTGALTVAIGGKPEAAPKTTTPSAMISEESSRAYELISETARAYGLSAQQEVVRPPGIVRLNRSNLIVTGSPRIVPVVSLSLDADEHLGFGNGAQGWYLTEKDKIYRSPCDEGEPADYAYIGRLPRPDTKGTFLYVAGIHAMGTLGAAAYLTENIEDLYAQVRNKRWSMLIECRFDPNTREIQETKPITQIYT